MIHDKMIKIDTFWLKQKLFCGGAPYDPKVGRHYSHASVFLLVFGNKTPRFLAIQKTDTKGYPWRNQIALPGGLQDASDPSPESTAFRELWEELQIPHNNINLVGHLGTFPTISNVLINAFVGIWNQGERLIQPDNAEIFRVFQIPFEAVLKTHDAQNFYHRIPGLEELRYPFKDVVIWGATARILHFFLECLLSDESENLVNS